MDTEVTFGEWLRQRRRMLDLTQRELAQQIGCAVVTIRKFESNKRRPSKGLAGRLAACLNLAPEEYDNFIAFARAEPYLDAGCPPAAPAAQQKPHIHKKLGRYEILSPIGRGGFATVYRARDTKLDRPVALKVLRANLLADTDWAVRFRQEARVIAHLDHPRIVAIYDVGQAEGCVFIVMRLVNGPGLDVWLAGRGRLSWSEAVEVVKGVAEGLDYAHGQGIRHRDLKPANILIDPERGPLLSDFGLAKLVGENSLTQNGHIVGTPHYIAPEIWDNQPAAPQTDIYALSCILYELLTGQKLFQGRTPSAVMAAHFRSPAFPKTWPEGTPPGLANALRTALAIQPDDRYATAGEMVQALARLEQEAQESAATLTGAAELAGRRKSASSRQPITVQLPPYLKQATPSEESASVFVARERELAELEATLATARAGQGQILFVIGGAGRGKTMLVREFARRAQAADPELIAISGYCNVHTGLGDPYLPFREALTLLTGDVEAKWAGGLITQPQARRLREVMPLTLPVLVEYAPDLIDSFVPGKTLQERAAAFASPDAAWFSRLSSIVSDENRANLEQKRIFAQYTALLKAIATQRPLLLIIEDLHWVDTSSSDLLFHLSREIGDSRILLVGTYRPEEVALSGFTSGSEHGERHPLAGIVSELKRRHGDIWLDLGKTAQTEGRRFVEAYLDTQSNRLSQTFRAELFQHTGGHALFTVELLREMRDRGDIRQDENGLWVEGETIDWQRLPAKIEGVIERRINRLEESLQAVLTIASVEGETFTAEVVARVQHLNERGLVQRLSRELDKQHRLVTAEALERLAKQRLSIYRFRHQLFQHYLYQHLDETERAYLHEEVGTILETLYGEQTEKVAVQLARHFEIAGLIDKAIAYLRQAGERASRLSAYREALAHFSRALTLLETLEQTAERTRQEITLYAALGLLYQVTKGLGAPEAEQAYAQARQLYQHADAEDTSQLFQVLWGLWLYNAVRSEHRTAYELAQRLWALGQDTQNPTLLLTAHRALGSTYFWLGELVEARQHLEQVIGHYRPQHHALAASYGGANIKVHCLSFGSLAVSWLGYLDQALQMSQEALALAQELSHPYSVATASMFAAWFHASRRVGPATQPLAEAAISLSTEHGFPFWLALCTFLRGWALAEQGHEREGIPEMRQGLAAYRATGAEVGRSCFLALLAEIYGQAGQVEEGLAVLAKVLTTMEKIGERFWEAEVYRIRGELLLKDEGGRRQDEELAGAKAEVEAEKCFRQAIAIARRQEAKSLELRATVSLARLWQSQGKQAEARQMLAEIYGWFSEGFDTADLREAKELLVALW